jgi:hypothetical protein
MNGYIAPNVETPHARTDRASEQVVHGDVVAEPAAADVNLMLVASEEPGYEREPGSRVILRKI